MYSEEVLETCIENTRRFVEADVPEEVEENKSSIGFNGEYRPLEDKLEFGTGVVGDSLNIGRALIEKWVLDLYFENLGIEREEVDRSLEELSEDIYDTVNLLGEKTPHEDLDRDEIYSKLANGEISPGRDYFEDIENSSRDDVQMYFGLVSAFDVAESVKKIYEDVDGLIEGSESGIEDFPVLEQELDPDNSWNSLKSIIRRYEEHEDVEEVPGNILTA